ncbi:MAG: glutathione S-transferase family protein [Pseudohongiellaceae bacterium]
MTDLIFYSNPQSRGQIAHWMLEELGEPYDTRWIAYGEEMKSAEYLAINPMGKVPALKHKGAVITEAAAICTYLAMTFPAKGLAPAPGSPALADFWRWLFFAAGPLEMAVTERSMKWETTPEQSRMLGYGSYKTTMDALDQHLNGREYICDSGFSAADVCLGSHIVWGLQFKTIESRPAFETYAAKLAERDAYKRAVELGQKQTSNENQTGATNG